MFSVSRVSMFQCFKGFRGSKGSYVSMFQYLIAFMVQVVALFTILFATAKIVIRQQINKELFHFSMFFVRFSLRKTLFLLICTIVFAHLHHFFNFSTICNTLLTYCIT